MPGASRYDGEFYNYRYLNTFPQPSPVILTVFRESMSKRDFLAITDLTRDEIRRLFDLAGRMKAGAYRETPLAGKTLAMIFAKSSTRTRVSFEVGTYQLGGQALFLSSRDIQIGRGGADPGHGARAVALRRWHHDPHVRPRRSGAAGQPCHRPRDQRPD